MTTFMREIVGLKPGEEQPTDLSINLPPGHRMETDAEFRARVSRSTYAHTGCAEGESDHAFRGRVLFAAGPDVDTSTRMAIEIAGGFTLDALATRWKLRRNEPTLIFERDPK